MSLLPAELADLLHPRIVEGCLARLQHGFYPDAARQAMVEVELALKEKGGVGRQLYGRRLVRSLLGTDRCAIKLRLPFGEETQRFAATFFDGTFAYLRNYAAHDGRQIDARACARIMIVASELLDLIGASSRRLDAAGGLDGLVEAGAFAHRDDVVQLLRILDGHMAPDDAFDGLWEELAQAGFSDEQAQVMFELGLVEMERELLDEGPMGGADHVDVIVLTHQGRQVVRHSGGSSRP